MPASIALVGEPNLRDLEARLMPICSIQNLPQASASFTYSTTYPTFMIDSRNAAPMLSRQCCWLMPYTRPSGPRKWRQE